MGGRNVKLFNRFLKLKLVLEVGSTTVVYLTLQNCTLKDG